MPRKRSITNVWLIPVTLLFLLIAISEAQPRSRWTEREENRKNLEDPVTSGIRNLEHIRRGIVESSLKGREDNRDITSMDGQRNDSGYSRYFSGTAGSEVENSLAVRPTEVRYPRRQLDSAMYEALSKLANVQIAGPGIRDSSRSISSWDESAGRLASRPKFHDSTDEERTKEAHTNFGLTRTLKNEAVTQKSSTASSKLQFIPRKFQCYPIREIYIPKVDKRMPAYACSLGKRAFVISSERFIQDSRDHFEVNVDEGTFRRLTPMTSGITTLTSGVSVLPATLVLKQGEDGYTVRGINANWKEVQATSTDDN